MSFLHQAIHILLYQSFKLARDNRVQITRDDNVISMMTSPNGDIFRVTGPLWRESTGHRWIPSQNPGTLSFDIFLSAPEQAVGQTLETLVIWDAIALLMTSL